VTLWWNSPDIDIIKAALLINLPVVLVPLMQVSPTHPDTARVTWTGPGISNVQIERFNQRAAQEERK